VWISFFYLFRSASTAGGSAAARVMFTGGRPPSLLLLEIHSSSVHSSSKSIFSFKICLDCAKDIENGKQIDRNKWRQAEAG
jgi:hypothetical protein